AEYVAERLERSVVINGDALDSEILVEANVRSTETVIAVADDDEVNILASLLAKRHGCQRAITLINNSGYGPLLASLGIDAVVNPRASTVSTILQHVRRGRIKAVHSLRDGVAEVIEAEALQNSPLVGVPLRDVNLPMGMIIGGVLRGDNVIIPRGDTVIQVKDRVVIFALADAVKRVEKMFSVRLDYF
nr:NAD-binding protein [Alphaproteobacteria bacterium]